MNFIAHVHDGATDPTGTHDIVRKIGSEMRKRWRTAESIITDGIEKNDLLGNGPGVGSYKLLVFQKFLDETLRHSVIEDGQWMAPYIADAIGRAEKRARKLLVLDADASSVDWQSILVATALTELQGVCEAASQQAVRAVSDGLISRQRPAKISRDIVSVLKNIGERRSQFVADYIVIKAFAAATLETFRAQGVTHVGTQAEMVRATPITDAARKTPQKRHGSTGRFTPYAEEPSGYLQRKARRAYKQLQEVPEVDVETAGDDRVCVKCENISAMGPYEIDTALSLIPAHPRCRCIFVPAGTLDENQE